MRLVIVTLCPSCHFMSPQLPSKSEHCQNFCHSASEATAKNPETKPHLVSQDKVVASSLCCTVSLFSPLFCSLPQRFKEFQESFSAQADGVAPSLRPSSHFCSPRWTNYLNSARCLPICFQSRSHKTNQWNFLSNPCRKNDICGPGCSRYKYNFSWIQSFMHV